MIQLEIDDHDDNLLISVDKNTAESLLADKEYAKYYINLIKENIAKQNLRTNSNNNNTNCETAAKSISLNPPTKCSTLWKSSKNQSEEDNEATLAFLQLRKKYSSEFDDKKTKKNIIWDKIAKTMNEFGYFVGEGMEGREKCRIKFANMQAAYLKVVDKRRQTGEGNVPDPPYFDEMSEILGDKHKVKPVLVIDTLSGPVKDECSSRNTVIFDNDETSGSNSPQPSTSSSGSNSAQSSTCSSQNNHRFQNIKKSVRPSAKDKFLETFVAINKENQEKRKQEFDKMIELMQIQSEQRHKQMLKLISTISNSKKRKHSNESSSSDND